jgi:hypothetical protein
LRMIPIPQTNQLRMEAGLSSRPSKINEFRP